MLKAPHARCMLGPVAGILIGTLTMEMGGKVSIVCEKTGYRADIEFKLKVGGNACVFLVALPHISVLTI